MAVGNITQFESASAKFPGAFKYKVTANSVGSDGTVSRIKAGEPVTKVAGAAGVLAAATNAPTTTLRIVGVATDTSTETASVDGTVNVTPYSGQIFIMSPNVAATWNTQAKYNALVGSRVLIDNTAGVYTILASDGASNGCVVEYLDVATYPGKVAFSFNKIVGYDNV
jgi:hypothetical protein